MHVINKSIFTLYSEQLLWQDLHVASIKIHAVFTSILCKYIYIHKYISYTVIFRNASQSFQFSINICQCRPEIQQGVGISLTLASSLWGQGGVEMWNANPFGRIADATCMYTVNTQVLHIPHTKFYATSRNNSIHKNAVACHVASCKGCVPMRSIHIFISKP